GSSARGKDFGFAWSIRTRTGEKPDQGPRSEFARHLETSRGEIRSSLYLRSSDAQTGLENFGASIVEPPDCGRQRRGICQDVAFDGVLRTNIVAAQSVDLEGRI